jgi:hypothetical protein
MPVATTTVLATAAVASSGFGLFKSSSAAKKAAKIQAEISKKEQEIEAEKRKAMELDARRRTLEVFRNMQRAKSIALTNATAQGAGNSSALFGGFAQIGAQGQGDLLNIGQNLTIGRNISGLNEQISGLKGQLASANADIQTGNAFMSFGKDLLGASASPVFKGK